MMRRPSLIDDVPLVTENILLAPEPYMPTCKSGGRCTKQCRQCCQCDCSRCGCDYDTYLLVDFLFFKRNNSTSGATIAEGLVVRFLPSRHVPQIQERHQAFVFLVAVFARMELAGSSDTPVFLACLANAQFRRHLHFRYQAISAMVSLVGQILMPFGRPTLPV